MKTGNKLKLNQRNEHFVALIFLVLCFFLTSVTLAGPADSLEKKFPRDDPRNPDCPCHRYQKRAEKEFSRLNRRDLKTETTVSEPLKTGDKLGPKNYSGHHSFFLKKSRKKFSPSSSKKKRKHKINLRFKRDIAACSH